MRIMTLFLLIVAASAAAAPTADAPTSEEFIVVSGPASPRVAYAIKREAKQLAVIVDVAAFTKDGSGASVQLGLAAGRDSCMTIIQPPTYHCLPNLQTGNCWTWKNMRRSSLIERIASRLWSISRWTVRSPS